MASFTATIFDMDGNKEWEMTFPTANEAHIILQRQLLYMGFRVIRVNEDQYVRDANQFGGRVLALVHATYTSIELLQQQLQSCETKRSQLFDEYKHACAEVDVLQEKLRNNV